MSEKSDPKKQSATAALNRCCQNSLFLHIYRTSQDKSFTQMNNLAAIVPETINRHQLKGEPTLLSTLEKPFY